jgi:tRNA-2-methylthio-N6-dimethylallyladenosine synthase
LQAVHVEAPAELIGQIVPVRIQTAAKMSLAGTLANQPMTEPA